MASLDHIETFDLLSTVEQGGCSAKLDPLQLKGILNSIPLLQDPRIMVDIRTHDDAGVYQLNDETALIVTTDFFPPLCSNPFTFGRIAAANSLSDIYAMGGKPLLVLNLNMFPSERIPIQILEQILLGGQEKINESGAFTMGGHTIEDYPPKYGLAVVGIVHPDRLISNKGISPGQKLILTKPLGTGIILAAHKAGRCQASLLSQALDTMQQLNDKGADIMQRYRVKGATDITGFGLSGHAMQMAQASNVTFVIETSRLPLLPQVKELLDIGCIPGGAFRNLRYCQDQLLCSPTLSAEEKLLTCDPQTSGGLLMGVDACHAKQACLDLIDAGYTCATIIGEAILRRKKDIYLE